LQQPAGQDAAVQAHCPPTHCCPLGQGEKEVPQAQVPKLEQRSAVSASQAAQAEPDEPHADGDVGETQLLPAQQPVGQEL
jgi:hypothetical protein